MIRIKFNIWVAYGEVVKQCGNQKSYSFKNQDIKY